MLQSAKSELSDLQDEQQQEMEGLLEVDAFLICNTNLQLLNHFQNVRQLTRELRLQILLIDAFIPTEYQYVNILKNNYQVNFKL